MNGRNWFRFSEGSGTKLQTQPNSLSLEGKWKWSNKYPCHTFAVGWLNGHHPESQAEGIIRQRICFAAVGWRCHSGSLYINIAKCEPRHGTHFYVYQLKRPNHCNNAYCAE